MNRLKQKLKSESGASILIALMFFLICALVASTLLMASVSNAGKIKSNQEMHRKYLTVSSALELICDKLTSAEYCGQYSFTRKEITDNTGTKYVNSYKQETGRYNCELPVNLLDELDAIFAETMKADVAGFQIVDNIPNVPEVLQTGTENTTHTLIVEPDEIDGIKPGNVQITVTLDRKSYTINLTARLVVDASYGMEAELTPIATNFPHAIEQSEERLYQTEPMIWKLGWITKASEK